LVHDLLVVSNTRVAFCSCQCQCCRRRELISNRIKLIMIPLVLNRNRQTSDSVRFWFTAIESNRSKSMNL
jgi:hypothetical protein